MNAIAMRALPSNLEAAATRLASAKAMVSLRQRAVTEARAAESGILDRLVALDAKRAALAARRVAGEGHPGDAGELELIALDSQQLEAMLTEARAAVSTPQAAAKLAENMRDSAQRDFDRVEHEVAVEELRAHAVKLDTALTETIARLNEHTRAIGGNRPVWLPSADLTERLRRLALNVLA